MSTLGWFTLSVSWSVKITSQSKYSISRIQRHKQKNYNFSTGKGFIYSRVFLEGIVNPISFMSKITSNHNKQCESPNIGSPLARYIISERRAHTQDSHYLTSLTHKYLQSQHLVMSERANKDTIFFLFFLSFPIKY